MKPEREDVGRILPFLVLATVATFFNGRPDETYDGSANKIISLGDLRSLAARLCALKNYFYPYANNRFEVPDLNRFTSRTAGVRV
jgi:hypothetical protein